MALLQQTVAHEETFLATAAGARAQGLRDRAQELVRIGQRDQAFDLFSQAVQCFDPTDDGAGAAAACHDLAEAFRTRLQGSIAENLRQSERLFRRALASPTRAANPQRRALTASSLASTLRHLAGLPGQDSDGLLGEALAWQAEAIKLSDDFGGFFLGDRARYLDTQANLHLQLGQLNDALQFGRKAAKTADDHVRRSPMTPDARDLWATIKCHLVRKLVLRGRRTDLREAITLAAGLRREVPDSRKDFLDLCEAEALRALGGPANRARARDLLATTRVEGIPGEHFYAYADLLADLDRRDLAVAHVRNALHDALAARRNAKADYLADHASARAYEAGRRLARLHLDGGDLVEAFLALENTSGLRYEDVLGEFARTPTSARGCALAELEAAYRTTSALVDDIAGMQANLPEASQTDMLRQALAAPGETSPPSRSQAVHTAIGRLVHDDLPAALRRALTAGDRALVLKEFADDLARRAARALRALTHHEPTMDRHPGRLGFPVEPDDLRRLLAEQPGAVFLRVSLLADELLAIAVFEQDGALATRSIKLSTPRDLLRQILSVARALPDLGDGKVDDHLGAITRLTATLAAIDLSPLFPDDRRDALVLLPDQPAALLPLAALGPPGARPIERFAAVTWLPCLGPLRCRQIEMRPRAGQVTLVPDPDLWPDEASLPDEMFVCGEDATAEALLVTGATADVVCLMTHAQHPPGSWPEIALADGLFAVTPLPRATWLSIERVEIWACETGVDQPSDPRGTRTNEFFGIDGLLLHQGARSAIGTLWQVSSKITAWILQRYRDALRAGEPADRALCTAQRRWISGDIDEFLGDAPGPWRTILECPTMWAGYRFAGVCERRPTRGLSEHEALAQDDEAAVQVVIDELEDEGQSLDDAVEEALDELDQAVGDRSPTADEALYAARLYRARILSSHDHNLLCALAWLHEATPGASADRRTALTREAVRVWLWLSLRETPEVPFIQLQGPTPERAAAMQRVQRLLADLPATDTLAERGMLAALAAGERRDTAALTAAVGTTCANLGPSLSTLDHGALAIACWIAATDVAAAGPHAEALLATVRTRAHELSATLTDIAEAVTLTWTARLLAHALGVDPPLIEPSSAWLPAPMLTTAAVHHLRDLAAQRNPAGKAMLERLSEAMTDLEIRLWDHPRADGANLWRTTGSAGAAYRRLAGWYLRNVTVHEHPERYTAILVASLQFLADLRLLVRNRLAHLARITEIAGYTGGRTEFLSHLWDSCGHSERYMGQLEAAALLPGTDTHTPIDPFTCTPEEVRARFGSPVDLPAWELAELTNSPPGERRTLAFRAIRRLESLRREVAAQWNELRAVGSADKLWRLVQPTMDVAFNQHALGELPVGVCVLACVISPIQELVLAAIWRDSAGLSHQRVVLRDKTGLPIKAWTLALTRPLRGELDGHVGPVAERSAAWRELHAKLSPAVAECLRDVPTGARIVIFAPGNLRPLPWQGLVEDRFAGVWHLPALGWSPSGRATTLACWIEPCSEPATTCHGEAVIAGLRSLFPPDAILGCQNHASRDIPEARQLATVAAGSGLRLRIYGVGFCDGYTEREAGLRLGNQRCFLDRNLADTCFGPDTEVELWSATPSLFGWQRVVLDHGDRIPGLAHGLLSAGASAVLDLAWPVHDLVKALVCEHYSLLRATRSLAGAEALALAVRWYADAIREATNAAPPTHEALLAFLDATRRKAARRLGVRESVLLQLPRTPGAPEITATLAELVDPVQCAAFRWWGSCSLGALTNIEPRRGSAGTVDASSMPRAS
jgi:hypothetical protein